MSSCKGVQLSRDSASVTQSEETPSRYLPRYSRRVVPVLLTTSLRSTSVYIGAAAAPGQHAMVLGESVSYRVSQA